MFTWYDESLRSWRVWTWPCLLSTTSTRIWQGSGACAIGLAGFVWCLPEAVVTPASFLPRVLSRALLPCCTPTSNLTFTSVGRGTGGREAVEPQKKESLDIFLAANPAESDAGEKNNNLDQLGKLTRVFRLIHTLRTRRARAAASKFGLCVDPPTAAAATASQRRRARYRAPGRGAAQPHAAAARPALSLSLSLSQ